MRIYCPVSCFCIHYDLYRYVFGSFLIFPFDKYFQDLYLISVDVFLPYCLLINGFSFAIYMIISLFPSTRVSWLLLPYLPIVLSDGSHTNISLTVPFVKFYMTIKDILLSALAMFDLPIH